jgi:hypothetical protein
VAKIPGYLEQRRAGWEAVVDVPPLLRDAVGRKRLRKGLGTRDKHVAKARLPKALLELHARIEAARRGSPKVDPVTAEALALAEQTRALRTGRLEGWHVTPDTIPGADGGVDWQTPQQAAWSQLDDIIGDRAEEIAREEGTQRGQDFASIARDNAILLDQHMERWLSEPGLRGRVRKARTQMEFRGIVQTFGAWLAKQGTAPIVQRVNRAMAGRYVSHLHQEGLSSQRIRDIASALSGYWQWMGRKGIVAEEANPWPRQAVQRTLNIRHCSIETGSRRQA